MKLLELYTSKTGAHKFVSAEGLRRTDLGHATGDNDAMLSQALATIEADPEFEPRMRIYDAHGIMLKGDVTRYVTVDRLKSWVRHDREPLAS